MTQPPHDDLESRLGRDLRRLTDGVDEPRDWQAEARAVASRTELSGPVWRRWALAGGSLAAGIAAVAFAVAIGIRPAIPGNSPEPTGSSSAEPTPSIVASAEPSATPVASAAPSVDLATTAWWDVSHFEFGYIEPPEPGEGAPPEGGTQVRIGTLDGTVRALLVVSSEWGHWAVGGPRDGRVLVANDIGTVSEVWSINALTGESEPMFVSDGIVAAVEPAADGDGLFYAKADAGSGSDLGVWFRPRQGREARIDTGPDGFGLGGANVWRLAASPDGNYLVAQYCHGQVSCESHILDLEAGSRTVVDHLGWVEGVSGSVAYAGSMAMDLGSTAVAISSAPPTPERRDRYDAELPAGWYPSWPEVHAADALGSGTDDGRAILRHTDGDEVQTPPLALEWPVECGPIMPRELPSGRTTSAAVLTLEDGIRGARIGQGDDLVFESFGNFSVDVIDAEIISIRGGRAQLTQSRWPWDLPPDGEFPGLERSVPAFLFGADGCSYSVALPGLTLEEAREYADRF
jgi:hypothetical protein